MLGACECQECGSGDSQTTRADAPCLQALVSVTLHVSGYDRLCAVTAFVTLHTWRLTCLTSACSGLRCQRVLSLHAEQRARPLRLGAAPF